MNFMMAGMAPTMTFLMMGSDMRAMQPGELVFWGAMSLGIIVGFAVAYPSNVWLVKRRLKHGLMTVESGPAPKPEGNHSAHGNHPPPTKGGATKTGAKPRPRKLTPAKPMQMS